MEMVRDQSPDTDFIQAVTPTLAYSNSYGVPVPNSVKTYVTKWSSGTQLIRSSNREKGPLSTELAPSH